MGQFPLLPIEEDVVRRVVARRNADRQRAIKQAEAEAYARIPKDVMGQPLAHAPAVHDAPDEPTSRRVQS